MPYLHPIVGALVVALLLWVGTQGLRARHKARYAPSARSAHARFAPYAMYACVAVGLAGPASVLFTRTDLKLADSWHFWFGGLVATLMVSAALTSKRIHQDPRMKQLHPYLGIGAMLLAIFGSMLGFGMLP